eukprot:4489167-Pyramimonas_sp.AAC.1
MDAPAPLQKDLQKVSGLGYEAPTVDQKWTRYDLKGIAINFKRLVHVLRPFGKAFIAAGLRPDQRDRGPLFARGC